MNPYRLAFLSVSAAILFLLASSGLSLAAGQATVPRASTARVPARGTGDSAGHQIGKNTATNIQDRRDMFLAGATVYARLSGKWCCEALANAGGCGKEYGEFIFTKNHDWSYGVYTEGSPKCAGVNEWGNFTAKNNVMHLHVTGTNCGECKTGYTLPEGYHFIGSNELKLCDYPSGMNCVNEYRQK